MKKHPEIDNPWALAWYMKNKGDKPHQASDPKVFLAAYRSFKRASNEVAMEFNTPEALHKYLEAHPGADKALHTVKKPKAETPGGEASGGGAGLAHPLAVPGLEGNPAIEKAKSGKATKEELHAAMEAVDEAADKLMEKVENAEDVEESPEYKKLGDAKEYLTKKHEEAIQKSPEYKTETAQDYYPQKKPKGYRDAEGAAKIKSRLLPEDLAFAEKMPEADIDKNEAYEHPRIKAVKKALIKKVTSGEITHDELVKRFGDVMKLRHELTDGMMNAKNDEEKDGWRFPARQLYKLWQGYNDALQTLGDMAQKKKKKPLGKPMSEMERAI
jgi:hypothetical protein